MGNLKFRKIAEAERSAFKNYELHIAKTQTSLTHKHQLVI